MHRGNHPFLDHRKVLVSVWGCEWTVNCVELRKAEVRRTLLLGTSVNELMRKSAGRA
jgi:hypothetical protein